MNWISRGWTLFKEQSGLWMQAFFFIVGAAFALSALGPVGIVIYSVLNPFLMAGFYHMAFRAHHGVNSKIQDMFVPFKDVRVRRIFLQLAALGLLVAALTAPLSTEVFEHIQNSATGKAADTDMGKIQLLVVVQLLYFMATFFAVPIAYFHHEQNIITVISLSFKACFNNLAAIVVFAVMALALSLMTFPTLGLAMVIVMPWLMLSSYLAFNDLIGSDIPLDLDDKNDDDDITMVA